jgi:hypothetical protein
VNSADTSGVLALQTAGTTALTLDASQNATFAGSVKTNTLTSAASTALTLQSAGTTAITVDTSQNVGIGTASPTFAAGGGLNVVNGSFATMRARSGSTTGIDFAQSSDGNGYIYNRDNAPIIFGTNNSERMRINAGAPILCLSGGSTSATGTGIAFPATQSASSDANTLDDYEEGTFTPTVQGVSSPGTATYSTQLGAYTKIGNLVYVNVYLSYTGGTGTGQLRVANLPFTSAGSYIPVASIYLDNIAYTATSFVQAVMNSSATTVDYYLVNGGGSSGVAYDAAGVLIFSLTYRV